MRFAHAGGTFSLEALELMTPILLSVFIIMTFGTYARTSKNVIEWSLLTWNNKSKFILVSSTFGSFVFVNGQTPLCRLESNQNMCLRQNWKWFSLPTSFAERKGTLFCMRTAKAQISLCIRAIKSGISPFVDKLYSIQGFCKRTMKALISLRKCAGWSETSLSAYAINAISRDSNVAIRRCSNVVDNVRGHKGQQDSCENCFTPHVERTMLITLFTLCFQTP